MMFSLSPPPVAAEAVAAAKSYLRIDTDPDDALFASLLAAAVRHAETFINQLILRREGVDRLAVNGGWQRLGATPVVAVTSVLGLPPDGPPVALPMDAYALDIDGRGDGWIRLLAPGSAVRVDVTLEAGIATDWSLIPDPLRLAVLRLVGHLYSHRDATDDPGPPAAVAALLRPWRRIRLA